MVGDAGQPGGSAGAFCSDANLSLPELSPGEDNRWILVIVYFLQQLQFVVLFCFNS